MNSELINELLNEILIERLELAAIEREPDIYLERSKGENVDEGIFYVDFRTDCLFLGFASGYQNRCEETNFDMSTLINEFNDKTTWH